MKVANTKPFRCSVGKGFDVIFKGFMLNTEFGSKAVQRFKRVCSIL